MIDPVPAPAFAANGRPPIVVLLVDDQPFVGAALGMLLGSEPDLDLHCCLFANNAIALAAQIVPAIVLQDLVMPGIDGLTLVRAFRANPLTADIPVVVLSGNDDAQTRLRALAAGASDYLVKLPPKAVLIACIRDHAARGNNAGPALDPVVMDGFLGAGAPEFAARLFDRFILEAGGRVEALRQAAGCGDDEAMKTAAHSLKGSASIMGATRLAALCGDVEDAIAAPGGAVNPALLAGIDRELARVQDALRRQFLIPNS